MEPYLVFLLDFVYHCILWEWLFQFACSISSSFLSLSISNLIGHWKFRGLIGGSLVCLRTRSCVLTVGWVMTRFPTIYDDSSLNCNPLLLEFWDMVFFFLSFNHLSLKVSVHVSHIRTNEGDIKYYVLNWTWQFCRESAENLTSNPWGKRLKLAPKMHFQRISLTLTEYGRF